MADETGITVEFTADVSDFASKTRQVVDELNKVDDAVKSVNVSGAAGGAGGSPYTRQLVEATRELKALKGQAGRFAGHPYWSEAIKKQQAAVDDLRKRDRAAEEAIWKEEQKREAAKLAFANKIAQQKAVTQRNLSQGMVAAQQALHQKAIAQQQLQNQRNLAALQRYGAAATAIQVGLARVGLGGVGAAAGGAMRSGAAAAAGAGMGMLGMGAGAAVGLIGGVAGGSLMLGGSLIRRSLAKNPALPYDMEMAGYVNPAEAMQRTRSVSKIKAAAEEVMTKTSMTFTEKAGDAFLKVGSLLYSAFNKDTAKLLLRPPVSTLSSASLWIDAWNAFSENMNLSKAVLQEFANKPTTGELRYWMDQSRQALGPGGPQTERGRMGLYSTATEAVMVNRRDITETEMITAMRNLTAQLAKMGESGVYLGIGAKGLTR